MFRFQRRYVAEQIIGMKLTELSDILASVREEDFVDEIDRRGCSFNVEQQYPYVGFRHNFWSAPAERSGDGALYIQSGVALRLPRTP